MKSGRLCFNNVGQFIPGSVESVIQTDAAESRYRNRFLIDAMVNLNMIDTIGSGIRKMFLIQKKRFFPLPEYDLKDNRVQKRKPLTDDQVKYLKLLGLIEGRKPNFHISAQVADHSAERMQYIHNRALNDRHYKKLILEYLEKFGTAKRVDINNLLLDKLPNVLDETQKYNKVKNLLQALKQKGFIDSEGKSWRVSKKI